MALSKIQAESMNLADTFAFTGTVTGTGTSLIKTADIEPSGSTTATFTSIPTGVKHIAVTGSDLSIASGSGVPNTYTLLQIGTGGSVNTTGYYGATCQQNSAGSDGVAVSTQAWGGNGWLLAHAISASTTLYVKADLRLIDSDANVWGYNMISSINGTGIHWGSGMHTLSGALDTLRVLTKSGYTYDGGKISIQYE